MQLEWNFPVEFLHFKQIQPFHDRLLFLSQIKRFRWRNDDKGPIFQPLEQMMRRIQTCFFFFYRPSQNPRTEADSKKSAGIFSFLFLTEEMQIEVKIPDTAMSVKRFQLRMLLFFFSSSPSAFWFYFFTQAASLSSPFYVGPS